jgi:hypothetical protein
MNRRGSRTHRRLAVVLAALVVVTGVPWSEVHAHGDLPATRYADTSSAQVEYDPGDLPQDGRQHVHENGLFVQCPGVSAPETGISIRKAATAAFPDPSIPDLHTHTTPLLRPPARH